MPTPTLGPFIPSNTMPTVVYSDELPITHVVHAWHYSDESVTPADWHTANGFPFADGNTPAEGQFIFFYDEGTGTSQIWRRTGGVPVFHANVVNGDVIRFANTAGQFPLEVRIYETGNNFGDAMVLSNNPLLRSFSNTPPATIVV